MLRELNYGYTITHEHDFSLNSRPHEHDCDTLLL